MKKSGSIVISVCRLASENKRSVQTMVADAVENYWCIVLIIDDYTTIHSKHKPTETVSSAASMCTIVCRVFPNVKAIPLTAIDFHNPNSVDITLLLAAITNMNMMDKISKTYADAIPP